MNLVENKVNQEQHRNRVLGIFAGVTSYEIEEYISTHDVWKIAVTYDSLERTVDAISKIGIDVYNEFFLLVDEWHVLFNSYVFRNAAVMRLLNIVPLFDRVTYMTATPIEEEFLFDEIKHLPVIKVVWSNVKKTSVYLIQTNKCLIKLAKIIREYIEGRAFGNLHIFVNSVTFIKKIIEYVGILPENVKVVCSTSNLKKGERSNQIILGDDYPIGKPLDPVKKINFYTSTCFEGCDIYDPNGRTIIVSDGDKKHSLLDISTLFIQICGRIRDSKYNDTVTYIFSKTRYKGDVTLDEFKEMCNKHYEVSINWLNSVNNLPKEGKEMTIKGLLKSNYLNENYVRYECGNLVIDKNLLHLNVMKYKIENQIFQNRFALAGEMKNNGLNVVASQYAYCSDRLRANSDARESFKDLFLEYAELRSGKAK